MTIFFFLSRWAGTDPT